MLMGIVKRADQLNTKRSYFYDFKDLSQGLKTPIEGIKRLLNVTIISRHREK